MNREVYPLGPPRCTRWDHLPVPIRNPRTPFFSYSYLLLSSNNKKIEWRSLWAKRFAPTMTIPGGRHGAGGRDLRKKGGNSREANSDRPIFVVCLRAERHVEPYRALRRGLKTLKRAYGLQ